LPDVAEGVRDVADHHFRAKLPRRSLALQQIADRGFRAYQKFIRQDVPGADQQASVLDMRANGRRSFWTHQQIVVKYGRLPIKHEILIIRVCIEQGEQIVNQVNEFQSELLKGEIPLPIPVRV